MPKHVLSEEWRERHASSIKKWDEDIKKKIEQKIPFDSPRGWNGLRVFGDCGYCQEFSECSQCFLFINEGCNEDDDMSKKFWNFVAVMSFCNGEVNLNPSWKEAERLRAEMVNLIKKDTPS